MASLYPTMTTEEYERFGNYLINDSAHDSFFKRNVATAITTLSANITTENNENLMNDSMTDAKATRSFSISARDMFHFILYTVVGGPICIMGFIANIICYKVLKMSCGKKHRTATFLLQALAVADNLYLILSFFIMSIIMGLLPVLGSRENFMSDVIYIYFLKYVSPFACMVQPASVWITVLLAMNRYIAVCRPFDAHRLASLKRTKIEVAVVVTLAIIFSLPYFFKFKFVYREDYNTMTVPSMTHTSFGQSLFCKLHRILYEFTGVVILPLILLVIFNSRIIWELRKADNNSKPAIRENGSSSENNITIIMVVIIIIFIVCNIPYLIQFVAAYTGHYHAHWRSVLYSLSNVLLTANSSTNFVVYYVLRKSFRRAFRKTLCCSKPPALIM